jgi:hypothetical protein
VHKLYTSLVLLFITFVVSSAQSLSPTVIATGGTCSFSTEGYSVSYTYGECSIKTFYLNTSILTEGFQQGKIQNNSNPVIDKVNVFPNPVGLLYNILHITLPVIGETNSYVVFIYTMEGKCMFNKSFNNLLSGLTFDVDVSSFPRGLFFVKIQSVDGQYLKTFKIEKF